MKAIRLDNDKGEIIDILNDLHAFQSEVGGYIESISLGKNMAMIVNEEGKFRGYAINDPATDIFSHYHPYSDDYIEGTAIITGINGENFEELSDSQIETLTNLLRSYGYYKKED